MSETKYLCAVCNLRQVRQRGSRCKACDYATNYPHEPTPVSDDLAAVGRMVLVRGVWKWIKPDQPPKPKPRKRALKPIKHGTYGGYSAHTRRGEEACDSCKKANAIYQQEKRKERARPCRYCGKSVTNPDSSCCRSCATRIAMQEGRIQQTRCECGLYKSKDAEMCQRCRRRKDATDARQRRSAA